MSPKNRYKDFVSNYLARGAIGISVGFAAVTPVSPATHAGTTAAEQTGSFSDRLSAIRTAVSEQVNELVVSPQGTRPGIPPRPPPEPFKNFFGKAPFQDYFANVPRPKPAPAMSLPSASSSQPITPLEPPKLKRAAAARHAGSDHTKRSLRRKKNRRLPRRSKSPSKG
jgi:hypothetical protein